MKELSLCLAVLAYIARWRLPEGRGWNRLFPGCDGSAVMFPDSVHAWSCMHSLNEFNQERLCAHCNILASKMILQNANCTTKSQIQSSNVFIVRKGWVICCCLGGLHCSGRCSWNLVFKKVVGIARILHYEVMCFLYISYNEQKRRY